MGRLDSSLFYFEISMAIKDSLYSENKLLEIGRLENKYTLEKKDYENKLLIHQHEINEEQRKRQRFILFSIIAFAVLLVAGTVLLWRNIRIKNQINDKLITQSMALTSSNALIQQKNDALEASSVKLQTAYEQIFAQKEELTLKNTQITDSIRSAKHIQEAIITVPPTIGLEESDSAIFWLPRDIVSGDFFWIEKIDQKRTIFSIADCTGHGIPGAFMSLLGIHFLEFIALSEKIISPYKILDALDCHIKKSLKDDKENQYGMDIAVCIVDCEAGTLEFAGAHADLHYWNGEELKHIKGDKKSIGSRDKKGGLMYQKHTLNLCELNRFFIYSDGFADQLSPERKRFGSQRLAELITKIAEFDAERQKTELAKALQEWKGEQEQTDDVILMSVRPMCFI
jgi:serine phosphatase RsbU (regulator of sigma subunit)